MSHDLSQPFRIGYLGEIQHTDIIQRDERHYEDPHSVGVWSLKIVHYDFFVNGTVSEHPLPLNSIWLNYTIKLFPILHLLISCLLHYRYNKIYRKAYQLAQQEYWFCIPVKVSRSKFGRFVMDLLWRCTLSWPKEMSEELMVFFLLVWKFG